jgi:predicted nucleic acid-binding protein
MASKRTAREQPRTWPDEQQYWKQQIETIGRGAWFLDTSAILSTMQRDDAVIQFLDSIVGDQLITSTYVVAETVRRIVKSKDREFSGPNGEQKSALAVFLLARWLDEHRVRIICPTDPVFDQAKTDYIAQSYIGCDLVDILSVVIVRGLEQTRIVSLDRAHFGRLGLVCYPT